MVEIEDRIGEKWKWKWKRAGEVKVPKRDDLVLWPYAAGGRNEGGKGGGAEGQGRAGRKAEKGRKRQQLVGGASVFLFLARILYQNTKNFSGMMA